MKKASKSAKNLITDRRYVGPPARAPTPKLFDYLIVGFLNVGYFFGKARRNACRDGVCEPEFYTFPVSFIRQHHDARSSWEKVRTRRLEIDRFKNERGFEQIARDLRIEYPEGIRTRNGGSPNSTVQRTENASEARITSKTRPKRRRG